MLHYNPEKLEWIPWEIFTMLEKWNVMTAIVTNTNYSFSETIPQFYNFHFYAFHGLLLVGSVYFTDL